MKRIALFVLGALAFAGLASADIKPTLDPGSPTISSVAGAFLWTYNIQVLAGESISATVPGGACQAPQAGACGTFFTIYDIQGLLPANGATIPPNPFQPASPAGWSSTIQLLGLTSTGVSLLQPDSPAVSNVTWTYTGATTNGPFTQDGFGFYSTSNVTQVGLYSSQNTGLGGTTSAGQGRVLIPAGVPEPASMLLIGGGLVGLALLRRKLVR